jgi:hypothetical protein
MQNLFIENRLSTQHPSSIYCSSHSPGKLNSNCGVPEIDASRDVLYLRVFGGGEKQKM